MRPNESSLYGIMGEFSEPEQLLRAARAAANAGYRKMDAYSPYAVEGVAEAIGFHKTGVPLIMLIGGVCGAVTAYAMQWYSAAVDYQLNVGGRPAHSWPAFIPITFELTVLFAAVAGLIGMLWLNGLPKPYHPVFNSPEFKLATQTHFFLCIEADDHVFDESEVREFFYSLGPVKVMEVEK
jgi:hypothetical protein